MQSILASGRYGRRFRYCCSSSTWNIGGEWAMTRPISDLSLDILDVVMFSDII